MKKNFLSVLSVILVIVLTTVLSLSVLATDDSSAADSSAVVESGDVSNVSNDSSDASNDSSDASKDASATESKDESKTTAKDESTDDHSGHNHESESSTKEDNTTKEDPTPVESDFPWARVITLIVIVVLILVAFILSKTNTKLGLKINKFFKEYLSEIKKVAWMSPKDTLKATGIVLVFIIVAAIAIGLLDFGFTQLVKLLADIFTK